MKNLPGRALCLLLLLLGSRVAGGQPPATRLDSLRQLSRWPLAAQVPLARARFTDYAGPGGAARAAALAGELLHRPGRALPAAVRLELLGNLAGYYLHENQPSLAMSRLLEVRQLAWADSARSANAAIWLSFCCQQLRQPRAGLAYGREAVRRLP